MTQNPTETSDKAELQEIIALKTTVISQQLYKQYEYLSATLRRLKIQLEKAVLTANLEAAGAKDGESSSSKTGGLAGGSSSTDKQNGIYLPGAENCSNKLDYDAAYNCIQTNLSLIISQSKANRSKATKQLTETLNAAKTWGIYTDKEGDTVHDNCGSLNNATNINTCAQTLNVMVIQKKEARKQDEQGVSVLKGLLGKQ